MDGVVNTTQSQFFQYWARFTFSVPPEPGIDHAIKNFMIWHQRVSGRLQFQTHSRTPCTDVWHGTYFQVPRRLGAPTTRPTARAPSRSDPTSSKISPTGQWHRFTYEFRDNSSPGANDAVARLWIDGVKVVDVSASAVGVIPQGGEIPYSYLADVAAISINAGIHHLAWGGQQTTSDQTDPWTYDLDDFIWWTPELIPARGS